MKQTAVEWLIEEIILRLGIRIENTFDGNNLLKQAKEMEKQNTINAHVTGLIDPLIMKNYKGLSVDEIKVEITKQAEQYYNETFKNETK
jgi:hypothetical protein